MYMPERKCLISVNRLDFGFAGILHPCIVLSEG